MNDTLENSKEFVEPEWLKSPFVKDIVFDSSSTANSIADLNGIIVDCNSTFFKTWGFDNRNEVIGKPIPYFFKNPEDAKKVMSSLDEYGSWQGEWEAKRKDGSIFTACTQATTIKNEKDEVIGYQSTIIDISEMVKTKEKLLENEWLLNHSQKAAVIGSYKYVIPRDKWESSDVLDEIFGIGEDYKRTQQGWMDLIHPDDRITMFEYCKTVCIEHIPFDKEYRIINRKDGKVRWVHGLGDIILNEGGKIETLIGTIQDITDMKGYMDKSKHNLTKFKDLIETTKTAFLILSIDGKIKEANDIFENILQCSEENLVGESIYRLLTNEDSIKIRKGIELMGRGVPIEDLEICINNKLCNRKGVWLRVNANIMENGGKSIMCLIQDITAGKIEEFKKYIADQKQKDRVRQNISRIRDKINDMKKTK